jgi:hypothetical protein
VNRDNNKLYKFLFLLYLACLPVNILAVTGYFMIAVVVIGFIASLSFGATSSNIQGYKKWSALVLLPPALVSILTISFVALLCRIDSQHSFCNDWFIGVFPLFISLILWFVVSIYNEFFAIYLKYRNVNRIIVVHYEGKINITSLEERGSNFSYGEPIHTTEVDLDQMTKVIEDVLHTLDIQYPMTKVIEDVLHTLDIQYPISQTKKGQVGKDPILTATGANSWEDLCEKGSMYTITWLKKEKHIDFWQMNANKLLETVPERTRSFTGNATIQTPIQMIVEDIFSFKA